MKRAKRCMRASTFAWLTVVVLALLAPNAANATSDYDNLLHTTPTLYVYTDGSAKTQKMDISATWWAEFKQTYVKRVAQNIGWPTNFATEFEDIRTSGGSWGVFVQETTDGNLVSIVGTHDPNAYCGFVGSASSGTYQCTSHSGYGYVAAEYFTHNSYGGNGCIGSYGNRCSDNGMNIYASPTVQTGTAGYTFVYMFSALLPEYKFYVMNFEFNEPSGYAGELIPTEPSPAKYVAMGDSFSSGEGNSPFEAGTDINDVNECHRSPLAYPRLLASDLDLGSTAFVACSGATTKDMLGIPEDDELQGRWNEPAQIDALSEDTDVVTITIGGNDVKFPDFAKKCVSPTEQLIFDQVCDEYTDIYGEVTSLIAGSLPGKLESVYSQLLSEAPNAEIYVGGYPLIAPYKEISDPFDQECGGLYDEFPNTWGDARAAYEVANLLNAAIEGAVDAINSQESSTRLHYVDVSGGAFSGHDICEIESYFNGIDVFNPERSIHPNGEGQGAYKEDFKDAIS